MTVVILIILVFSVFALLILLDEASIYALIPMCIILCGIMTLVYLHATVVKRTYFTPISIIERRLDASTQVYSANDNKYYVLSKDHSLLLDSSITNKLIFKHDIIKHKFRTSDFVKTNTIIVINEK